MPVLTDYGDALWSEQATGLQHILVVLCKGLLAQALPLGDAPGID